jgi:hypothetical protein
MISRLSDIGQHVLNTIEFDFIDTAVLLTGQVMVLLVCSAAVWVFWNIFMAGKRGVDGIARIRMWQSLIIVLTFKFILN